MVLYILYSFGIYEFIYEFYDYGVEVGADKSITVWFKAPLYTVS